MSYNLSLDEAEGLARRCLEANAVSPANAACVARALVAAEADGQRGHGLSRLPSYAGQAQSGKVDGFAKASSTEGGSALLRIDAKNGFAFPALALAIEGLADLVPETGIAAAAIRRSHHCGQAGYHVEQLAARGLVALMLANSPRAIAPWGGNRGVFGTNPLALAAPREEAPPLVIDLSLSKVARGKIMAAAKAGEAIPEGWALGPEGEPTSDPEQALAGTMIPIGEAKGVALALMVEILAASLVGAQHGFEASSFFSAEGPPPGVGQLIITFAPGAFSAGQFAARLEALIAAIEGQEGARLPGSRRLAARQAAARDGISIPDGLYQEIISLSQ